MTFHSIYVPAAAAAAADYKGSSTFAPRRAAQPYGIPCPHLSIQTRTLADTMIRMMVAHHIFRYSMKWDYVPISQIEELESHMAVGNIVAVPGCAWAPVCAQ